MSEMVIITSGGYFGHARYYQLVEVTKETESRIYYMNGKAETYCKKERISLRNANKPLFDALRQAERDHDKAVREFEVKAGAEFKQRTERLIAQHRKDSGTDTPETDDDKPVFSVGGTDTPPLDADS